MKFYFASRFRYKEKISEISKLLESKKHKVISSWINSPSLKPYEENEKECRLMAKNIESEIKKCDVFVLIDDRAGTDMFVELGIAISLKKKIYVVGKYGKRSLMHLHPQIKNMLSMDDLLRMFL